MKKKIEINTMMARNVYFTESFDFVKKVLERFYHYKVPEKAKEIHKQNKPFDYTDEYRIYGATDQGLSYHSYYKASEKEMRTPVLYTVSCETFGWEDFWIKFTISSQDGLIFEFDIANDKIAKQIEQLFEAEYGYCRKQTKDEIFDEILQELRTRGSEENGQYGIKMGLKAIKLYPEDFWARFYLGCAYALNNQHQKAIEHLKHAIKSDPKSYDAYYNLGKSYLQLNELEKAKKAMQQALVLAPKSHAINYYMGVILEKMGAKTEAAKYYQQAISLAPERLPQTKRMIKSFYEDAKKRLEELQK